MKYRITHSTHYHYSQLVGLCQNEARLRPRDFWRQQCHSCQFDIVPQPGDFNERSDYFGNNVAYFAIQQPHQRLVVTVVSEVTVFPKHSRDDLANTLTWEQVRLQLQEVQGKPLMQSQNQQQGGILEQSQSQNPVLDFSDDLQDAKLYLLDSPMVVASAELFAYAQSSFQPNRPLVQAVADLMRRIHVDFTYDPSFTTIATPLSDVLHFRRGVCQDFAHLAIGC